MADLLQEKKRSLTGWPMIIGLIAMLIFALHSCTHMVGAGDTWVALACGRHFYNHGVDTNEPFSANSHRQGPTAEEIATWPEWAQTITNKVGIDTVKYWHPTGWVNQNWLTHVIFYWLAFESPFADGPSLSFNSLMYWKFAVYILAVICIYYTGRVMGVHPALSAAAACASMFVGRSFIDIRPAGFSNLMVAVFLLILVLSIYRNYLYIWLLLPATIFWANLHGGYIYIFIMLTPVVGIRVLGLIWRKLAVKLELAPFAQTTPPLPGTTLPAIWHTIAAGTLAFLASIIFNPFHLTNLTHTFQISISTNAEGWRNVHEWWPAFRWDNPVGSAFPFLVMMVVGIGLLVIWPIMRFLSPKQQVKALKVQAGYQPKQSNVLANVVGFLGAALVIWAITISCSLADASIQSFLLNGLFVGILWSAVFVNVHIIYLILPFGLFALYASTSEPGYAGRYYFPFAAIPFYCGLFAIASRISKKPAYSMLNMVYVSAASIATILISAATVNPFKLAGPWWHLEQFAHLTRQWTSAYEANLDVSYPYYFYVVYAVNAIFIVAWFVAPYVKVLFTEIFAPSTLRQSSVQAGSPPNTGSPPTASGDLRFATRGQAGPPQALRQSSGLAGATPEEGEFRKPRIDLALVVIAALTVYMAYRSRRFIPIAGYVTCPVIALLLDQIIQMAAASRHFRRFGRVGLPRMSVGIQSILISAAIVVVLVLGGWWGYRFKSVYMDPWPTETKLTSAFIRMTASSAKPFAACQFITENKLRGNMFNYWTEGGFIAWGQTPDADGHTPLQLFMDGRAQAAYNYDMYLLWSDIMAGGPVPQRARMRNQSLTPEDYVKTGEWLDARLKQYKVWVVLMPRNQFELPFVKGIEHNASWRMVYLDDEQKLYVDISTQRGLELFKGIEDGATKYPSEYYRNLLIAHNSLLFEPTPERLAKGLKCAISAFSENPARTPMQLIQIFYERYPEMRPEIDAFFKSFLDDFEANRKKYLSSNGYYYRAIGALIAIGHLEPFAAQEKNNEALELFQKEKTELQQMTGQMQEMRW